MTTRPRRRKRRERARFNVSPPIQPSLGPDVALVEIEDPYGLREFGGGPPKISALASIRDDPLGRLHARGQIDEAKYNAGRLWQREYECSQIGQVKAIDTTKEPVDGGSFPEPMTERQRRAMRVVSQASAVLGKDGDWLVRQVLGERRFLFDIATMRGDVDSDGEPKRRAIEYYGQRLRECLETLAVFFNLASPVHNRACNPRSKPLTESRLPK